MKCGPHSDLAKVESEHEIQGHGCSLLSVLTLSDHCKPTITIGPRSSAQFSSDMINYPHLGTCFFLSNTSMSVVSTPIAPNSIELNCTSRITRISNCLLGFPVRPSIHPSIVHRSRDVPVVFRINFLP